jgi:AcrR family transcriptional regulator
MPPGARRRLPNRAARRDDTRDRLLDATAALLAHGGSFSDLSVSRLATKAGISRATFYIYFEDKAELVRAWFDRIDEEAHAATAAWWTLEGEVTRDDIHRVLTRIIDVYRQHGPLLAAVQDMAAYDPLLRDVVAESFARAQGDLCDHIAAGQASGQIDATLLPHETSAWLSSMVDRIAHEAAPKADEGELAELLDAGADILWNTLYAPTI